MCKAETPSARVTPELVEAKFDPREVHPCVIAEMAHHADRRAGTVTVGGRVRRGKSEIEIIGADYRRKHGLGRPLASGLRGLARQPTRRQRDHAITRVRSLERLHGAAVAASISFSEMADAFMGVAAAMLGMRRFLPRKP
jgi:hypothetical protein